MICAPFLTAFSARASVFFRFSAGYCEERVWSKPSFTMEEAAAARVDARRPLWLAAPLPRRLPVDRLARTGFILDLAAPIRLITSAAAHVRLDHFRAPFRLIGRDAAF